MWRKILGGFLLFVVPRAIILTVVFPMAFLEPEMSDQPWTEYLKLSIYFLLAVTFTLSLLWGGIRLNPKWRLVLGIFCLVYVFTQMMQWVRVMATPEQEFILPIDSIVQAVAGIALIWWQVRLNKTRSLEPTA